MFPRAHSEVVELDTRKVQLTPWSVTLEGPELLCKYRFLQIVLSSQQLLWPFKSSQTSSLKAQILCYLFLSLAQCLKHGRSLTNVYGMNE